MFDKALEYGKKLYGPQARFNAANQRGFFAQAANRTKGFGGGAMKGYGMGFKGNLPFFLAFGAYSAITAERGHKISAVAGSGLGFGIASVAGGAVGEMFGGPIGGYIGSMAAGLLFGGSIDKAITNVVQPMVDFGTNMRRQNFGGDYRDTQQAYTMRAAAARELGGSLMNARQWLGQESAFLHQ